MKTIKKFIFILSISSLLFIILSIILWTPTTNKIMRHKSFKATEISNSALRQNNIKSNQHDKDTDSVSKQNDIKVNQHDKDTDSISKQNDIKVNQYDENISSNKKQININNKDYFNYASVKPYDPNKAIKYSNSKNSVIGIIKIPSVNINLPIYKGLSNKNLSFGVGTMRKNEVMGEGNYVLGGHYISDSKALLSPLANVKLGSIISLTDGSYVYYYKISSKKIISQNNISILNDTSKKIISLVTCASAKYGESRRLYVQGDFLSKKNANN